MDARLIARIDLDRLIENWRALNALSAPAEAAAVVKANGYGHGMRAVALALYHAGCRWFFTASMDEAIALRAMLTNAEGAGDSGDAKNLGDSREAKIACFDGLDAHDDEAVLHLGIMPSINDGGGLEHLARLSAKAGRRIPALIQVDTGMNRLGWGVECLPLLAASPHFAAGDWRLIMSHLACADEPHNPLNHQQRQRFEAARRLLPPMPASLAATGGIMLGGAYHYDLTRPGIGLYGLPQTPAPTNTLTGHIKPILSLHARVLQIRQAEAGASVGYGASLCLARPSRLATIAGGYADGVRRHLSNNQGHVHASGLTAPIVGRVSMDTTIIDITDWPHGHIATGDYVDIIHDGFTADDLASATGTIGYDVLTTLGLRAKPHYIGAVLELICL